MYVQHRFRLDHRTHDYLQSLRAPFGYNGFGELTYYRTYSRIMREGGQEAWADTVVRVTEGTFSVRKDFYLKNRIPWEEAYWQEFAKGFSTSMFLMKWMPPGRGLWAMGSDFVYERGSMALYNCALTELRAGENFVDDIAWLMDSLMLGCGVGFVPLEDDFKLQEPARGTYDFRIPDSREGWIDIVARTLRAFVMGEQLPYGIYDDVRPAGMAIKGFGGMSSGPEPLKELVTHIVNESNAFLRGERHIVEYKTNISNMVGCCVVAGNVRRSAEIACGSVRDQVFMNLKQYNNPRYAYRAAFGWMSNNSAIFESDEDFDMLGEVAQRVLLNGEPGVINRKNLKHGRIGKTDGLRVDRAIGFNPCGEIPLEHRELCNLSETLPTMCDGPDDWLKACEYATFYCTTVSLLPTHQPATNKVIARNRRIGVGIIDYTGWKHVNGVHKVTKWLRAGYSVVRETARQLCAEAGVPEPVRHTCMKPGGTVPKLPGKTSGCGHPTFKHTIRRIRIAQNSPAHAVLVSHNIPYEKDFYSANTDVFEFPIIQGPAKPAEQVSLWEQANNLVLLQREWADNAVSNTLYFRPKWKLTEYATAWDGDDCNSLVDQHVGYTTRCRMTHDRKTDYVVNKQLMVVVRYDDTPGGEAESLALIVEANIYEYDPQHEEDAIEAVLSSITPLCKSISLLPHTSKGVYKQMPEEGISESEYEERLARIRLPIDWSEFSGSDGIDERYCQGQTCEIKM